MTATKKHRCTLCDKEVVKLPRHMKIKHHIQTKHHTEPNTLKDFIKMIVLFPISPKHWKIICKKK